jgi:hypothetical protein
VQRIERIGPKSVTSGPWAVTRAEDRDAEHPPQRRPPKRPPAPKPVQQEPPPDDGLPHIDVRA